MATHKVVPEHLRPTKELLAKLSPMQQQVYTVRMSQWPPLSAREVAKIMDCVPGTIAGHWAEIKRKLDMDPLKELKEQGLIRGGDNGQEDIEPMRDVSPEVIAQLAGMRAEELLRVMRDRAEEAPIEKIPDMVNKLIGTRQVLRGEPTQILRVQQRANMKKLLPAMVNELKRRGMMINGEGVREVPKPIEAEPIDLIAD